MRLTELLREASLSLSEAEVDTEIVGITSDSRRIKPGYMFVALSGTKTDGYLYIDEAIKNGATFVVAERACSGVAHLVVPSARAALAYLLDAWYGHPSRELAVIGITGTNGKTSTAEMLYHILRFSGCAAGMIGTVSTICNGESISVCAADRLANMTTPDPEELYAILAQMREQGASYVIMEVTSHAMALSKVAPIRFKRALFTNLSPDHLDFHGDMESYYVEKRKLFSQCELAVISTFSNYGERLAQEISVPHLTVGREELTNVRSRGITGSDYHLTIGGLDMSVSLQMPGSFSVENSALAAVCALSLGISDETVGEALRCFSGVRGRMERVDDAADICVLIDYAHTPDALERLLLCVRQFRTEGQRIILVFGCGGDRDRGKRKEMGRIATRLADLVVLTSDNSRSEDPAAILRDILKGIDKEKAYTVIPDRREAICFAIRIARKGDIVILAGKGHEAYEIRGGERLPFSEHDIVKAALEARGKEKGYAY